jgi:hypothetical protein
MLNAAPAQVPAGERFVGTVGELRAAGGELHIKPDAGEALIVKVGPDTLLQRVAPGEKDLKRAETIAIDAVSAGDRVFVTLAPGTLEARRIVVMPVAEIAKRNAADRADWSKRGVSGIVSAKTANAITLRIPSFPAPLTATVTVDPKTVVRRYAPDSVRFADAKPSGVAEVGVGDQLRARGRKSVDGQNVAADEIVFGTFVTKAGSVTFVNLETKEITLNDLATRKPLVVKVTADSQLKMMPSFQGTMPGPGMMGGGAVPRPSGGPPDLSQMLERMPAARLEDLTSGMIVAVSSTKGAVPGEITAITLLANAGMLIQMAGMTSNGRARPDTMGSPGMLGMAMGDPTGGMGGGLNLPGMIP